MPVKRSLVLALFALECVTASACGARERTSSIPSSNPSNMAPAASGEPALAPPAPRPLVYPVARRVDQLDVLHGVAVADPYRWLEDGKSTEVMKWAGEQDALARAYLATIPGRDDIAARLREVLYVESAGVPRHFGNRWFFARRDAGKEKATVYWREGEFGSDKVLLDPNEWSGDGSVALGVWSVSWDGRYVAYTVRSNNSDEATLFVMDVATAAKGANDVIEGTKYAFPSWTPAGDGFYYTWLPALGAVPTADRPGYAEVRFHKLGSDPATDKVVRERTGDPKSLRAAELSKDGRWLVLTTEHGWSRADVEVMDLRGRKGGDKRVWLPLAVGRDALYSVDVDRDRFFVHTNDGAAKYRVFRVDSENMARENWTEIVPERKGATLVGCSLVGHRLALSYLEDVVTRAELRDEDGKLVREFDLPGLGSVSGVSGDVDDDRVYYSFQSFTYPTEIFETSAKGTGARTWYKLKVPVDPSKYTVERFFAMSKDGARIPFFVVHSKALQRDGAAPTILNGYGGFQVALAPFFASSIYPWLERGGVWVVANLRGGSEYGEEWHRQGMRRQKQNVFDDCIAVAEELIRLGFTQPRELALLGRSNGGLLVGAALTQRPDLFGVALCEVPLLDMVRYHLFGSGKTWIEEYGSADDAEDFKALLSYSPYHHVRPGTKYPATLLLSADSDDRVDPMHARKFAAELQWASRGGPVLLRVEKNAGHGGADLVKANVEKIADEYAFALQTMRH
jgi:prolyl oligopeptidase